jgi:DNA topoisomerase VI subunit A
MLMDVFFLFNFSIHPSDIEALDIPHTEMTTADFKKVDELLKRPYINDHLKRELNYFKTNNAKAEIENIYTYSMNYLVNDYIPRKIRGSCGQLN